MPNLSRRHLLHPAGGAAGRRGAGAGMQFNRHFCLLKLNLAQVMFGVLRHVQTLSALVLNVAQNVAQSCAQFWAQSSICLLNCTRASLLFVDKIFHATAMES